MRILPLRGENVSNEEQITLWKATWGTVKRGIMGSMAAVLFGMAILAASIMAAANPLKVRPYSGVIAQVSPTPAEVMDKRVAEPVGASEVEYYLPYPGMLPDNPLYKLKAARDRVRLMLTFSQEKKAELELAYADKRINAAMFLLDGGKEELAISTATKAEKYLEQSANRAIKLVKEGKDVKSLLLTLTKAEAKHYELLEKMQGKAGAHWQEVLSKTKEMTKNLQEKTAQALMESK